MREITFIFFLFTGVAAFGQEASNLFIEAHYTGLSYEPDGNKSGSWRSGFGVVVNHSPVRHFSLELAYEFVPLEETRGSLRYTANGQIIALRAGFGKAAENWSLRGLVGVGARFSNKTSWEYDPVPPSFAGPTEGTSEFHGRLTLDLGVRYTHSLNDFLSINAAAYANFTLPLDDEMSSSFQPGSIHPMNAIALLFVNAGIAWNLTL
jgi:hypothetical protein